MKKVWYAPNKFESYGEEVDTALFKESLVKAGVAPGSDIANSFAVFIKETGMTGRSR